MGALEHKIAYSIALLRRAETLALRMSPDGYHLAFSGGKDSVALYHLAKMAGVKFKAHMQITTIDPPELMRFVRSQYPDVVLHRPEINIYKLIEKKKMLPIRTKRYCCAYLKEQAGGGTVTLLGIRAAESPRRAARNEVQIGNHRFSGSFDQFNRNKERDFACVGGKDKIMLSPIYRWQDSDVWNFIRGNNLPYCRLYDEGYQRIGCIFCPMSSVKNKARDRRRYPGVERAIKRSIQYLIDTNGYMERFHATTDEIFDWWVSNLPADQYFSTLRLQQKNRFRHFVRFYDIIIKRIHINSLKPKKRALKKGQSVCSPIHK